MCKKKSVKIPGNDNHHFKTTNGRYCYPGNKKNFLIKSIYFLIFIITMTIGYITNDFSSTYNCTFWEGLQNSCKEKNINFLNFSGGDINHPDMHIHQRNKVHDLISSEIFDGLIINTGTLFHFASKDDIDRFYEKFDHIPIINLGNKYRNITTVHIDNETGVHAGIVHLIQIHGLKKIAFIRGPVSSKEAESRYNAYKNTLGEYGIDFDVNLIETGNFTINSGSNCLEKLLTHNTHIEAVVAANDYMALGVLNKAREMGIVVPNEIAIMGFDDIGEGQFSLIPLTTVRQPILKQIEKAVELLYDSVINKKIIADVVLPTELVVRRSCGCLSETALNAYISVNTDQNKLTIGDLKKDSLVIIKQLKENNKKKNMDNSAKMQNFLLLFIDYMEHEKIEKALLQVDKMVNRIALDADIDINEWQNFLSDFIKAVIPYINNNKSTLLRADSFFHQVRILINEMGLNSYKYHKFKSDLETERVRWINGSLVSIFDLDELIYNIAKSLPSMGLESYYLSLYEDMNPECGYSRLILSYQNNTLHTIQPGGIRFKTMDLLPESIKKSEELVNCVVDVLYHREEQYGFVIFKTHPKRIIFERLTEQISSALKGALLIQENTDKENKLKILLDDQKKRSEELENAYTALKDNQKKMIISEKMASLGRMTAGIAHEMNTPLAAVRATMEEFNVLVNEYKQSIGNPDITIEDHYEIIDDMKKSIDLAKKATERVVNYVHSIKFQTRDLSPKQHLIFKLKPVIEDSILLLNHYLGTNNCTISINSDNDQIELFGSPVRLSQVITNLVTNAINALKRKGGGHIEMDLISDDSEVKILIKDTGDGIEKDNLPRIFDPLFTTNSFDGGTGLGLSIVHDIITGDFEGSIEVASIPGEGTTFILHFPKPRSH
ncbi:MAG: substrate-binding domain-containing protein [Spirochaetales bacterium]|nr:substrate-binding domain-containing protein [Spirochaetales bacterium]